MKTRFAALVCLIVVAGCLIAFARPQAATEGASNGLSAANKLPILLIQEVETDSPDSYLTLIEQNNKTMKEKFGVDTFIGLSIGESAGHDTGKVFAVRMGESFAKLAAAGKQAEDDLSIVKSRPQFDKIRKLGVNTSYKAVRFEGRTDTWFLYNTKVTLTDEAGYLAQLDGLRTLLDSHDFKDVQINCFRVVSGRTDHTHVVSLNCKLRERRAAMMDALTSEAWASEWIAAAGKYRTVVSNGTYRQLTH